jgi:hypothetical protein
VAGWLGATVRDGPGWRAAAYLLVKLPVTVGELYAASSRPPGWPT